MAALYITREDDCKVPSLNLGISRASSRLVVEGSGEQSAR